MAERLIDLIFKLAGKEQSGPCVIVCDQMVHEESRMKVKTAAEVAFSSVDLLVAEPKQKPKEISAYYWKNLSFIKAAEHIYKNYRTPWLFLEPGCVPVTPKWFDIMCSSYDSQPKRYMGTRLMAGGRMYMSRYGVFPQNAWIDLSEVTEGNGPLEFEAGDYFLPKLTRTKLFQYAKIVDESDLEKLGSADDGSVVVVGDSSGIILEKMYEMEIPKRARIAIKKKADDK